MRPSPAKLHKARHPSGFLRLNTLVLPPSLERRISGEINCKEREKGGGKKGGKSVPDGDDEEEEREREEGGGEGED